MRPDIRDRLDITPRCVGCDKPLADGIRCSKCRDERDALREVKMDGYWLTDNEAFVIFIGTMFGSGFIVGAIFNHFFVR